MTVAAYATNQATRWGGRRSRRLLGRGNAVRIAPRPVDVVDGEPAMAPALLVDGQVLAYQMHYDDLMWVTTAASRWPDHSCTGIDIVVEAG